MSKTLATWLTISSALIGCFFFQGPELKANQLPKKKGAATAPSAPPRALLNQYCVGCHNLQNPSAGLMLDKADVESVGANPALWEKVLRKVRTGEMPPAKMPRPQAATLQGFTGWLQTSLDHAAAENPNPGRVPVHRLNRVEYSNAIRDLLALDIDARSLLMADDVDQHGFDNIAGVLSLSPALLERYISAARKISRLAVGEAAAAPGFDTYKIPNKLSQDTRVSDDLPFGSRGGAAVYHRFPVDGEYVLKVRLRASLYGYVHGLARPHQLDFRVNDKLIKTFTVGGDAPPGASPATYSGNITGDTAWDIYMHEADSKLEVRVPMKAGTSKVSISFRDDFTVSEDIPQPPTTGFGASIDEQYYGLPAVDLVLVGGPYDVKGRGDTPSRRKIFTCNPATASEEQSCARNILSSIAKRAYRRPLSSQEIDSLLGFYSRGRAQGGFEGGVRLGIERILADPNFVFRVEADPDKAKVGTVYRLSDLELASRLSFFLWSSIPDDELLDLAINRQLQTPGVLNKQVRRMLADSRSKALVENFVIQWLDLRKLKSATPDPNLFPEFDENLRQALQREVELFVDSQLRADRPIGEMLTANYTFLNERLAKHYGIPKIYGNQFRRVLLTGNERGGLLGHGAVLLATSYPDRTSPVLRGKWLLDNILGMPPAPPPADVPALKESSKERPTSVRARLEEHRKSPACSGCHVRMDPLGFALENFNAIGAWRTTSDGVPVDASASFPDGTQFKGVAGLQKILGERQDQFVSTFTEKLLVYGVGRQMEAYDMPAVRKITRDASVGGERWSAIIMGIVNSAPFQMGVVGSAGAEVASRSH